MDCIQVTITGINDKGMAVHKHGWFGPGFRLKFQLDWFQKKYPEVVRMLVDVAIVPNRQGVPVFVEEDVDGVH